MKNTTSSSSSSSSWSSSPSSYGLIILYTILLLLGGFWVNVVPSVAALSLPKNIRIPAVLVLGDSIVDPGNNNNLNTLAKSNFPPYGRDFIGGESTGRFSNGKIPTDFIANLLGIKELLPAYLDPTLQIQDLLTGVSFASGAAGYDPLSAKLSGHALLIEDQVNLLKEYIGKITSAVGEDRAATIISESLFLIVLGSNDVDNTYYSTPIRSSTYDINSYGDLLAGFASSFYEVLYGLGARRIGVVGLPPLGCTPTQITLSGGPNRTCSEKVNQAAELVNSKLISTIDSLSQKYPDLFIIYLDIYYRLMSLVQNAPKYGFEVLDRGCCGTGTIEAAIFCNALESALTCTDASKYIFWDGYHPTQKAYQIISSQIAEDFLGNMF